jgi:hypothetical protein
MDDYRFGKLLGKIGLGEHLIEEIFSIRAPKANMQNFHQAQVSACCGDFTQAEKILLKIGDLFLVGFIQGLEHQRRQQ